MLPEILLSGENIYSSLPISAKLLYGLNNLIPMLTNGSRGRFRNIKIYCPVTQQSYTEFERYAGTGMSFGIDSLYSYDSHSNLIDGLNGFEIKVLAYMNHGSLNGQYTKSPGQMRACFQKMVEKVSDFSERGNTFYIG